MKNVIFIGITLFALAGLIVPMTIQTSYANHPECNIVGEIASAELNPRADRNGNGFICVIKQIETPHGTVVVAIDDETTFGCHVPQC